MTDAPPPDPDELMQIPPMKRSDIGNLLACLDGAVRGQGLQAAETCLALAAKLTAATPVAEPADLN